MRLLLASAMLVCSCAAAPKDPFDPFALEIEAGRWGVMSAQSRSIIETLPASAHPLDETDLGRRAALDRQLRQAVLELAGLKSWACRDEKLSRAACASDYAPVWGVRREKQPPSWAELRRRSDAVGAAVMPVWGELCAQAKAMAPRDADADPVCPME